MFSWKNARWILLAGAILLACYLAYSLLRQLLNSFGSLAYLFILATVVFAASVDWLFRNRKSIEQKDMASIAGNFAAISVGVISLLLTINTERANLYASIEANRNATVGLIRENRAQDVCEFNNAIINDITELVAKVSLATQYGIGIPTECYDKRDGSDFVAKNPYVIPVFEQRRLDTEVLDSKFIFLMSYEKDSPTVEAYNKYKTSIQNLMHHCADKPNFSREDFLRDRQQITLSGSKLIGELADFVTNCYNRLPPEVFVR